MPPCSLIFPPHEQTWRPLTFRSIPSLLARALALHTQPLRRGHCIPPGRSPAGAGAGHSPSMRPATCCRLCIPPTPPFPLRAPVLSARPSSVQAIHFRSALSLLPPGPRSTKASLVQRRVQMGGLLSPMATTGPSDARLPPARPGCPPRRDEGPAPAAGSSGRDGAAAWSHLTRDTERSLPSSAPGPKCLIGAWGGPCTEPHVGPHIHAHAWPHCCARGRGGTGCHPALQRCPRGRGRAEGVAPSPWLPHSPKGAQA